MRAIAILMLCFLTAPVWGQTDPFPEAAAGMNPVVQLGLGDSDPFLNTGSAGNAFVAVGLNVTDTQSVGPESTDGAVKIGLGSSVQSAGTQSLAELAGVPGQEGMLSVTYIITGTVVDLRGAPVEHLVPGTTDVYTAGMLRRCPNGPALNMVYNSTANDLRLEWFLTTGQGFMSVVLPMDFDPTEPQFYAARADVDPAAGTVTLAVMYGETFEVSAPFFVGLPYVGWDDCTNEPQFVGDVSITGESIAGVVEDFVVYPAAIDLPALNNMMLHYYRGDPFIRGDVTNDGAVGIPDALALLNGLPITCDEAADANSDGVVNGLVDGLYIINGQFGSGPNPGQPFPNCAFTLAPTALTCTDGGFCN